MRFPRTFITIWEHLITHCRIYDDVDSWGAATLTIVAGDDGLALVKIPVMVSKDGCIGVKCLSEAWMVEWMMVGGLR